MKNTPKLSAKKAALIDIGWPPKHPRLSALLHPVRAYYVRKMRLAFEAHQRDAAHAATTAASSFDALLDEIYETSREFAVRASK